MTWKAGLSTKAKKQARKLPKKIQDLLTALVLEIEASGPIRGNWPNYSKLEEGEHLCHLTYSYVACWKVKNKTVQLVEVYYVGSREKAPY